MSDSYWFFFIVVLPLLFFIWEMDSEEEVVIEEPKIISGTDNVPDEINPCAEDPKLNDDCTLKWQYEVNQ